MRVLHFCKIFSPPSETFIYDAISLLEENGVANFVATLELVNEKERPIDSVFCLLGKYKQRVYTYNWFSLNFWKLFFESPRDFFIKFFKIHLPSVYSYILKNKLIKFINDNKLDIIHCHFGWGFYEIYKILGDKCFDFPLIVSLHGSDIMATPDKINDYTQVLLQAAGKKVLFTVNSEFLRNQCALMGIPETKVDIIYNTVSDVFIKNRKKTWSVNNALKIINVGRFVPLKGHKYLIEAFALFLKDYPLSTLTLIGYGELESEIKKIIRENDLEHNVIIPGKLDHSFIPAILAEHDIYVQPSINDTETKQVETFGIVILEAIMAGLPVIVTDTGGMPEVVGKDYLDKFAFIVPEKDARSIYDTFTYLIGEAYTFRDNQDFVNNRLRLFSKEKYFNRLMHIYDRAVAMNRSVR